MPFSHTLVFLIEFIDDSLPIVIRFGDCVEVAVVSVAIRLPAVDEAEYEYFSDAPFGEPETVLIIIVDVYAGP